MPKWPFCICSSPARPCWARTDSKRKLLTEPLLSTIYNMMYLLVHFFTWLLHDVSSDALPPEIAFFHQGPQPACCVTSPPGMQWHTWAGRHTQKPPRHTEKHVSPSSCWAHQQSASAQVIQQKVSWGSDTDWEPDFKIQYRNRMCFISLIWRFSH